MSEKTDIWMPLYIGDLIADTMHLSAAEFGAYMLLICSYWRNQGPLKDEDRKLAAIARIPFSDWPNMRQTLSEFFQVEAGMWRHKRIDRELASSHTNREARSKAGILGNQKRWSRKGIAKVSQCDNLAITERSQKDRSSPSSSPSPTPVPSTSSASPSPDSIQIELVPLAGDENASKAKPSSLEQVQAYCQELELTDADAEYFFHHFEGNGWKNGRHIVKDWKATLRAWKAAGYLPSVKGIHPARKEIDHSKGF